MNAIFKRRSIRKYTTLAVSSELVEELLMAGMNAPSAGNEQPWHFVVIDQRSVLDRIPGIHPHSTMIKTAPVAILVCGDLTLEQHKGYWIQDCSAATENILIYVAEKGLGAVWLGVYPREERVNGIKKLLDIPEHIIPFALIPLGYPDEEKPPRNNFDRSRIHYNSW
ncbi:MAG: nitroreductase family protein [bacterium]